MDEASRIQNVGLYEAKTNLSRLVRQTRDGKSFVITQRGKPVAELRPVARPPKKAAWGDMAGRIWMADDFCDPIAKMKEHMPG